MEHDWLGGIFTAFLLAPPSVLGVRSLIRGPTRFAGKVVPIGMDRLAAAAWLSPFPLTIAIVFFRLYYSPPRTQSEANHLANEWGPLVLRALEHHLSPHRRGHRPPDGEAGSEAQSRREAQSSTQEAEAIILGDSPLPGALSLHSAVMIDRQTVRRRSGRMLNL